MKKLILILAIVFLSGCTEEEESARVGEEIPNFYVPDLLHGDYHQTTQPLTAHIEKHRIQFNYFDEDGVMQYIDITQGHQMATDHEGGVYVTMYTDDNQMIYIRRVNEGIRLDYQYHDSAELIFKGYYNRTDVGH